MVWLQGHACGCDRSIEFDLNAFDLRLVGVDHYDGKKDPLAPIEIDFAMHQPHDFPDLLDNWSGPTTKFLDVFVARPAHADDKRGGDRTSQGCPPVWAFDQSS